MSVDSHSRTLAVVASLAVVVPILTSASVAAVGEKTTHNVIVPVCKVDIDIAFSKDAVEDVDGAFIRRNLEAVSAGNFDELKRLMRPFRVTGTPTGGTATIDVTGSSIEVFSSVGAKLTLPAVLAGLPADLLVNGSALGTSTLVVSYARAGAKCKAKVDVRVGIFPGLASQSFAGFPHAEYVRGINAGEPLSVSLDPERHKERVGLTYTVYVVPHKSAAQYEADNSLSDVTGKTLAQRTFSVDGTDIASNFQQVWDSPTGSQGSFDIVLDFGNDSDTGPFVSDGEFNPGDIIGFLSKAPDITDASNTTPIVITAANHGLVTGDSVQISGVLGNTGANGTFSVTFISADTFELDGSAGTGTYTGGGSWPASSSSELAVLEDPGAVILSTHQSFAYSPGGAVTGATNASPIVITSTSHGLVTGDAVVVSDVTGNLAANGTFQVTHASTDTFELDGTTGTDAYAGGGVWSEAILVPAGFDGNASQIAQPLKGRFVHAAPISADMPLVVIAHGNHRPYTPNVTAKVRPPEAARDGYVLPIPLASAVPEVWTLTYETSVGRLTAVDFVSVTHGWVVGDDGIILATTDGGSTWKFQTPPASAGTVDFKGVDFFNSTAGWIVGAGGTILMTTDGGMTWVDSPSGETVTLNDVSFISATTGWAVGVGGTILHKTAATAWTAQNNPSSTALKAVDFFNATTGFAVGSVGIVVGTTDGGTTWLVKAASGTGNTLNAVDFVSPTLGWAAGDAGTVRHTANGGTSFADQGTGSQRLAGISLAASGPNWVGWAVGNSGTVLHKTATGTSWTTTGQGTTPPKDLLDVSFVNASSGWAVGIDGTIITTATGGTTWAVQTISPRWIVSGSVSGSAGAFVKSGGIWILNAPGKLYVEIREGSPGLEWQDGDSIQFTLGLGGDPLAPNYDGYQDLQEQLAARGYASLSVDLDSFSGLFPGIRARAWVLLKNVEEALASAGVSGAAQGNLDASNILLVGHSRGGEAILQAYRMLQNPAERPIGATLAGFDDQSIQGLVSISPTVFVADSASGLDKPFLLIYGGADGDVNGIFATARPFRLYDRADKEKQLVYIEGANHNHFNDSWACDDARQGGYATALAECVEFNPAGMGANLVAAGATKTIARAYVGAFAHLHLSGNEGMAAFFRRSKQRFLPPSVAATSAGVLRGSHSLAGVGLHFVVDDYDDGSNSDAASSGASITADAGLIEDPPPPSADVTLTETDAIPDLTGGTAFPTEYDYDGFVRVPVNMAPTAVDGNDTQVVNRYTQQTGGVVLTWSTAKLTYEFEFTSAQDFSRHSHLSVRVANKTLDPKVQRADIDFTMVLVDSAATPVASNVRSSVWAQARGGYVSAHDKLFTSGIQYIDQDWRTTSGVFQTFRFDLAAFTNEGNVIDLSRIKKIRFEFGGAAGSDNGRMAIDDVEITAD